MDKIKVYLCLKCGSMRDSSFGYAECWFCESNMIEIDLDSSIHANISVEQKR